jgi:hypothetical protein
LNAGSDDHPHAGTLIFMGADQPDHLWLQRCRADRIIVSHTTHDPVLLSQLLAQIADAQSVPIELVYCSKLLANLTASPGRIEYPAIAVERFGAPAIIRQSTAITVGKLCRNAPNKHHPNDPSVYRTIVARGHRVRVMSGSFMELFFRGEHLDESIELLPMGACDTVGFLKSLDCFFYRTRPGWLDGFGRVVAEAMTAGLPVVCGRAGGYAELIEHGVNGFLFDNETDALDIVERLAAEPAERARVGKAARETMVALYSPAFQRETVDYYLG